VKKLLFLFSALTIVLTSCANDDDNSSSEENYILPKIFSDGDIDFPNQQKRKITNTFSGNKLVSSVEENFKTLYTYEGNAIVKEELFLVFSDNSERKFSEVLRVYENGKLKSSIERMGFNAKKPNGQDAYRAEYTHVSDKLIALVTYSINLKTEVETKMDTVVMTFNGTNLIKYQSFVLNSATPIVTELYEYDTKNRPHKNVLGFNFLNVSYLGFGNSNNVIKKTVTNEHIKTPTTFLINFTYNDKGYPTRILSLGFGNKVEENHEYTY
jgi:hypothetical protein